MSEDSVKLMLLDDHVAEDSWVGITLRELGREGYQVDHFTKMADAEVALKKKKYDLLIVDIDLASSVNGIKAVGIIREMKVPTPIVLVSGDPTYLEAPIKEYQDAFRLGAIAFYIKSSDEEDFLDFLERIRNEVKG